MPLLPIGSCAHSTSWWSPEGHILIADKLSAFVKCHLCCTNQRDGLFSCCSVYGAISPHIFEQGSKATLNGWNRNMQRATLCLSLTEERGSEVLSLIAGCFLGALLSGFVSHWILGILMEKTQFHWVSFPKFERVLPTAYLQSCLCGGPSPTASRQCDFFLFISKEAIGPWGHGFLCNLVLCLSLTQFPVHTAFGHCLGPPLHHISRALFSTSRDL